jgi:hypothetical protein
MRWSADALTATCVAGYFVCLWWPEALQLTKEYGPKESGDIKMLGVLVFLALGFVGTGLILGLSLVVVVAGVRLLPSPLRAAVRGVGVSVFLGLAWIYRQELVWLLRHLVHGTLRRHGIGA